MENRSRKNQLKIYLNDEELALFREKMKMTNSKTMAHFIRKTVLEKEILSTSPFNEHLVSFLEPGGVSRWAHS